MKGKVLFVAGAAVGYVLGARAGRKRYEQIKSAANKVWETPGIQRQVHQVQDFAAKKVGDVPGALIDGVKKLVMIVMGARGEKTPTSTQAPARTSSGAKPAEAVPPVSEAEPAASKEPATAGETAQKSAAATTSAAKKPAVKKAASEKAAAKKPAAKKPAAGSSTESE